MSGCRPAPETVTRSRSRAPTYARWVEATVVTTGVARTTRVVSGTSPHRVVTGSVCRSPGSSWTQV